MQRELAELNVITGTLEANDGAQSTSEAGQAYRQAEVVLAQCQWNDVSHQW